MAAIFGVCFLCSPWSNDAMGRIDQAVIVDYRAAASRGSLKTDAVGVSLIGGVLEQDAVLGAARALTGNSESLRTVIR